METLSGEQIDETFLRGKWTLVYLLQGACDKSCVEQLYNIRQVRLAQGKNIDRLQRLLVWESGAVSREDQVELQKHFPGQFIVPLNNQQAIVQVFSFDEQQPMAARRVYLIDPLGNLMMRYEPDDEPKGMIRDLERLLKYSGLG
jgi:cytochrome oxidase Cu insertion factor (SCO1/SenC/PrrC family)